MPEFAFIDALSAFLSGPASLQPAPVQVGSALPVGPDEAPAIVLALEKVRRLGGGLGEGAEPMTGVLSVFVEIDLAAPFLPGEPDFSLVSPDRTVLTLPHGGQIRADGLDGAPGAGDIGVGVAGVPQTLVAGDPAAGEFNLDGAMGQLRFGAPLPPAGPLNAGYHLGAWERRSFLIAGELLMTVRALSATDVATLSAGAARALSVTDAVPGLRHVRLTRLGPVQAQDAALAGTRGQTAHYDFEYQHLVDAPSSSGGIIRTIPLTSHLRVLRLDPLSGAAVQDTVTETG